MKVLLREMPCHRHFTLDNEFVREAVAELPLRTALERPLDDPHAGGAEADVDLLIEGENVFLRGRLHGWVEIACSRCVGPVRVPIDETLAVTFRPAHMVPEEDMAADEEVELTEDDLDLYPYEGDEIDLAPLFREQVIMAIPFAPLCSEACKGLCPVCGADLNAGECGCDRQVVDPRLAALKDLKV